MQRVDATSCTNGLMAACPHLMFQCRGDFGGQAMLAQVQAELRGYSDHQLHAFCSASRNKRLQELVLPADKVCACPCATFVYLLCAAAQQLPPLLAVYQQSLGLTLL